MGLLDGLLGGGGEGSPMGAITDLLGQQEGGLGGLLGAFEQGGLGEMARSWVGTGENLPVSADQIQTVLSSGVLADFASRLGIDPKQAAGTLAEVLPQVIDRLTPNGELPAGGLGGVADLLGKLR